jgi:hypothetical protein
MALLRRRAMSGRARLLLAGGMVCLFTGLQLPMFFPHAAGTGLLWLHGVRGVLLGLAITLNFGAGRADRHGCGEDVN